MSKLRQLALPGIKNYVNMFYGEFSPRILIGNDGKPVLSEVPYSEVFSRLRQNHENSLVNKRRVYEAQSLLKRKGKVIHV